MKLDDLQQGLHLSRRLKALNVAIESMKDDRSVTFTIHTVPGETNAKGAQFDIEFLKESMILTPNLVEIFTYEKDTVLSQLKTLGVEV